MDAAYDGKVAAVCEGEPGDERPDANHARAALARSIIWWCRTSS